MALLQRQPESLIWMGSGIGRERSQVKGLAGVGKREGQSREGFGLNNLKGPLQARRLPILK